MEERSVLKRQLRLSSLELVGSIFSTQQVTIQLLISTVDEVRCSMSGSGQLTPVR